MRTSKREHILEAVLSVVESEGVSAVTFESVSAASGLSKGGLLYHFPTKEAMIEALHERIATQWEKELTSALGKDPATATEDERLASYARVGARPATGPELLLMLESAASGSQSAPWREVMARWLPDAREADPNDPQVLRRFTARLAADGLWLADSMDGDEFPPALRAALAQHIASLVE